MGTVDLGASAIQYDGFLTSGAVVLSPAVRFDATNASVGAQGDLLVFESGNSILQATAAGAWLTPRRGPWRGEFSGSIGAARYDDAGISPDEVTTGYGHVLLRGRLHYDATTSGAWVSAAAGGAFARNAATPLEVAIGGWTVHNRVAFGGTITASAVGSEGYVDVAGSVRWATPRVIIDAQAGVRPTSNENRPLNESRVPAFGELSASVAVNRRLAVLVSGGRYASDRVRGSLAAVYATIGVRFNLFRAPLAPPPVVIGALARAADAFAASNEASPARFEINGVGAAAIVRVETSLAQTVELMGDFTDWQPIALTRVRDDLWEATLPIAPGAHRLNVRINGGPWVVPLGTRLEETEFGSAVGVVVVSREP